MDTRPLAKLYIDAKGQLFVSPEMDPGETYEHIYREANGLRWHRGLRALHAYEPQRWEHVELLRHIAATLKTAYNEDLQIDESTAWEGVPEEIQAELRSVLN